MYRFTASIWVATKLQNVKWNCNFAYRCLGRWVLCKLNAFSLYLPRFSMGVWKRNRVHVAISRLCRNGNVPLVEFASSKNWNSWPHCRIDLSVAAIGVCMRKQCLCTQHSSRTKLKKKGKKKKRERKNIVETSVCAVRAYVYWGPQCVSQCVCATEEEVSERAKKKFIKYDTLISGQLNKSKIYTKNQRRNAFLIHFLCGNRFGREW